MIRASTSQFFYLGSISLSKPSKTDSTAYWLALSSKMNNVEIKMTSSLVLYLVKVLIGIPTSLCGRQTAGSIRPQGPLCAESLPW